MNDHGKSDSPVVPAKPPNKPVRSGAEVVEGRGLAKGNAASETRPGRSAGLGVPSALDRVRQSSAEGQGCTVHRAPSPRDRRSSAGRRTGRSARTRPRGSMG